jgi:hypothetical protein
MNRKRVTTWLTVGCLVAVLLVLAAPAADACPMCKNALGSGGGDIVNAYMWSILFMLSMPFTLLGGFSLYMWREVRKARQQAEARNAASVPPIASTPVRERETVGV